MTARPCHWRVMLLAAIVAAMAAACHRDAGTVSSGAAGAGAAASGTVAAGGAVAGGEHNGGVERGAAAPKVLAEATNQAAALTVQVLRAQRVTPDTVRIEIALINRSRAPEPLDVAKALTGGAAASFTPADVCLLTADGSRRLFVLRDAANAPLIGGGGFEPLQPGERRLIWAMFPSPGPAPGPTPAGGPASERRPVHAPTTLRVRLLLASMVLRDVPIAAAPAEADAP